MVQDGSFKDKHLFVLKSTGLGVTEFMLRLMAWLCVKDNTYREAQMVIITGPNLSISSQVNFKIKGNIRT